MVKAFLRVGWKEGYLAGKKVSALQNRYTPGAWLFRPLYLLHLQVNYFVMMKSWRLLVESFDNDLLLVICKALPWLQSECLHIYPPFVNLIIPE